MESVLPNMELSISNLLGHNKLIFPINCSLLNLTFLFTRDYNVAALTNWSDHTAAWRRPWWMKWPLTRSKKMRPVRCKKYPECPFVGQMPDLEKIDI